ncbi:MAG: hypothetical protein CL917_12265 [Deltaproteobacteria bacterium]|nr:hypothetical protein [Deltaproteobacteria bacterium]
MILAKTRWSRRPENEMAGLPGSSRLVIHWAFLRVCFKRSLFLIPALMGLTGFEVAGAEEVERGKPAEVYISIASPKRSEVVKNRVNMAEIRGTAQSGSSGDTEFDVFILIDVSHSTRYPSGLDIDEDGEVGINPQQELIATGTYPEDMICSDPEDTILSAEVKAARLLLDVLDPAHTQLGIIVFSGAVDLETGGRVSPDQRDALVKVPLTRDFSQVSRALDEILEDGSYGATNFSAAIQLSVVELAGIGRAYSEPTPGARKVALFLTDGVPTFPFGQASSSDPEDVEAALAAARLAKTAGVMVNTFALGQQALASPMAPSEVARITQGRFIPVRNPGDIVSFLQGVSFADIDDVVITNVTTGDISYDVQLSPDGTFYGIVAVREGVNQMKVSALASDGGEASSVFDLNFEKSGLTARELERELERIKKRNQALMRMIEKQRIEEFRKRQRRRVEIEAEDE